MSNTKHTPGPWFVKGEATYREHSNTWSTTIVDKDGNIVQYVHDRTKDGSEANAKLIAAAPELLESLTGKEEDQPLYAVNWLATLLRICRKKFVYNTIVEDQSGDFDSVNTMLMELETLVKTGNEVIKKATE